MHKLLAAIFVVAGFALPFTIGTAQAKPVTKSQKAKKPAKKKTANGETSCTACCVPRQPPVPNAMKIKALASYGSISRRKACSWIAKKEASWLMNAVILNKEKLWWPQKTELFIVFVSV